MVPPHTDAEILSISQESDIIVSEGFIRFQTEQQFGPLANRSIIQIIFNRWAGHRRYVMKQTSTYPESTYSIEQIVASAGIVIGMAFGIVAFVSAPIAMTTMAAGTVIGFVASRVLHDRAARARIPRRRVPDPTR